MSSSWNRSALKYALLLAPTAVLALLVGFVVTGAWLAAILQQPARYGDAPAWIQVLTRSAYWHTRTHWQVVRECAQFDAELLYRPRPGSCVFRNAEFDTRMTFDESGARRTSPPAPSGDSKPRLVVLGDSHAMGWGVEDHETFASTLASVFGFPAVNLAVSSYGTPRELRHLERDFQLLPGDVIVLQYTHNDYEENLSFAMTRRVGPYQSQELENMQARTPVAAQALPLGGVLLRLFGEAVKRRLTSLVAIRATPSTDRPDPTTALIAVLEAFPFVQEHVVVVIPVSSPGHRDGLDRDRLAAASLRVADPALERHHFYDIDDHMRPSGHRIAAQAIAAAIAGSEP